MIIIYCNENSPQVSGPQGEAAPTSLSKAPLSAVDVCATWDGAKALFHKLIKMKERSKIH